MFDFSHLPQNAVISEYVFRTHTTSGPRSPMVWSKPPQCRFVFMLAIGGGGGGGQGNAGSSGTSRSGGGGGASGTITQALFLAWSIPNNLYLYTYGNAGPAPGAGGFGATAGGRGSTVAIANYAGAATPSAIIQYLDATGGGGGSLTAAGTAGAVATTSTSVLIGHSIYFSSVAGRAGTFATNGLPANTSLGTGLPILGGGGGGGVLAGAPTVFNGAGFSSDIPAILPSIAGGLASSALDASSGVRLPFISVGGAGGGGNDNGPGGRGGNGVGYGAGGGGGGAGTTSGRGGDGGPGYACIIAW